MENADRLARMGEAYRRGILPPEKASMYEEAMRRGLVPSASKQPDIPSQGLQEKGNIDLNNRPMVKLPDGKVATVASRGFNIDGQEVVLPTVSDDGRILTADEAVDQYMRTGKHLGKFDTRENASAFGENLHLQQQQHYLGDREQPTPQGRGLLDSMGRGVGLGTRSVIEGLGSLPDVVMTPVMQGVNKVNEAFGGAPNYFPTSVGVGIAGGLGLPTPETEGERLASEVQKGIASVLPSLGAGVVLKGAAKLPAVAESLLASPYLQAVSGGAAGGASELARQEGAGPGGQLAAGLAGGFSPTLLGIAKSALSKGITAVSPSAERLYQSALKPSTTLTPQERRAILQTGIKERILPTEAGGEKLQALQQQVGGEVGDIVAARTAQESAGAVPLTVDPEAIAADAMEYLRPRLSVSPEASKVLGQVEDALQTFRESHPAPVDTATAQAMKQRAQLEAQKSFGEPMVTPAQEAKKALAYGLREAVEQNVPGVKPLNQRLAALSSLEPELQRAIGRAQNWDIMGLAAGLGGGGGAGAAVGGLMGAPYAGMLIGAGLGNVLRQPGTKARMAFGLDALGKNTFGNAVSGLGQAGAYSSLPVLQEPARDTFRELLNKHGIK